jgi:hypothetical protein
MNALPSVSTLRPRRTPSGDVNDQSTPAAAVYDDYRRAVAAVEHLADLGIRSGVHVALVDFEDRPVRAASSLARTAKRAVWTAVASSVATVAALGQLGVIDSRAPRVLLVVTVGVVAIVTGIAMELIRVWRHGAPVTKTQRLVPSRYEVRCGAGATTARTASRRLAAWWKTGLDGGPCTPDGLRLAPEGDG